MASIRKRESSWVADIRRKGHKSISKSFPTKGMAQEWARKIEREMVSKLPLLGGLMRLLKRVAKK